MKNSHWHLRLNISGVMIQVIYCYIFWHRKARVWLGASTEEFSSVQLLSVPDNPSVLVMIIIASKNEVTIICPKLRTDYCSCSSSVATYSETVFLSSRPLVSFARSTLSILHQHNSLHYNSTKIPVFWSEQDSEDVQTYY